MKTLILSCFLLLMTGNLSQAQTNLYAISTEQEYENVQVTPLHTDTLVSSFVIWVKKDVAPHLHTGHTEHIVVLEGLAEVLLGNETLLVGPGDLVVVPKGTRHAVKVLSPIPLKVLSIQAPKYRDGVHRTPQEAPADIYTY
ncbi:MAG: cupin domain-containing protein [Bacteroidetes bacterium]|nr:cupin domain-containing protein [Bacteroidota bacterium]